MTTIARSATVTSAQRLFTVVIVTYGDRLGFLEQVVESLKGSREVAAVVVVDNGAKVDVRRWADGISSPTPVHVVTSTVNLGSAGGFAAGLKAARSLGASPYVLLLDDDNVLRADTLTVAAHRIRQSEVSTTAWMLDRRSRPEVRRAVRGRTVSHYRDTYCGFSLRGLIKRRVERSIDRRGPVRFEYAPYGGLVIPADALAVLGLPREDYFLYCDDHEYTTRLVRAGFCIEFVRGAIVDDVNQTWSHTSKTMIAAMDPEQPESRVFYSVRNRRHFELAYLRSNAGERLVNLMCYSLALALDAIVCIARGHSPSRVVRRLRIVHLAARNGRIGNLGVADLVAIAPERA